MPLPVQETAPEIPSPSQAPTNREGDILTRPPSQTAQAATASTEHPANSVAPDSCRPSPSYRLDAGYWSHARWRLVDDMSRQDGSLTVEIAHDPRDQPTKASMVWTKNQDQPPSFCPTSLVPIQGGGVLELPFRYREGTRPFSRCFPTFQGGEEKEVLIAYEMDTGVSAGPHTEGEGQFFMSMPLPRGTVEGIMSEHAAAGVLIDMAAEDVT